MEDVKNMRTTKNIKEKSFDELWKEGKQKEKQEKLEFKAEREKEKQERRNARLAKLKQKRSALLERKKEELELQKTKASIRKLKHEQSLLGRVKQMKKQRHKPTGRYASTTRQQGKTKIITIDGKRYKLVPLTRTSKKPKQKKREEVTL